MKKSDLSKQQNTQHGAAYTDALIGSATYAARARQALAAAAIRAEVIKRSSTRTHGCIYGVRFASTHRSGAAVVLRNAGIVVREYTESDT